MKIEKLFRDECKGCRTHTIMISNSVLTTCIAQERFEVGECPCLICIIKMTCDSPCKEYLFKK